MLSLNNVRSRGVLPDDSLRSDDDNDDEDAATGTAAAGAGLVDKGSSGS